MNTITPVHALTREEVADLARNAADNNVPLPKANVFEPGTDPWSWFNQAYWERDAALRGCEA